MESPDEKHEAEGLLVELCKRIDELASLSDRGYFETEAGSSLALDNAAIHPLSVTAASSAAILSAIDHLNTVAIVVRAGTLPWVSLFTLLRSVIETSSVAIYVLQSESRSERILRVLRGQFAEIKDRVNSQKNLGEPDVDAEADKDLIRRALAGYPDAGSWEEIAGKNGARSGPDPSITQKILLASASVPVRDNRPPSAVLGMWQLFSGITHARQYAMMTILDKEELEYDEETGVVNVHFTTGARSLVGSIVIAIDVVNAAVQLYGRRSTEFTKVPEDVVLEGILRKQQRQ